MAAPLLAEPAPSLQVQVEAALTEAPKGTRFGLLVVDDAGNVIASVNPDGRFIPASNTKMFTTAAAYALLPGIDEPDRIGGTELVLGHGISPKSIDVRLVGKGDARMSSAADCKIDCLATLADAVAARTKVVGDIIGDETAFLTQPWSPGMSWNNIGSNDATTASALSLDNNELLIEVQPTAPGLPPTIKVADYVTIYNDAKTTSGGTLELALEHKVNSRDYRLYGTIPMGSATWSESIGIDDPADYTATQFAKMIKARGVTIKGRVRVARQPVQTWKLPNWKEADHPGAFSSVRITLAPEPIAKLVPPPLAEDVVTINKASQNLHAELLLRRIGTVDSLGSIERGIENEKSLLDQAGIPREGHDFSDGSGMSTYNRVSPRAAVALLRWIDTQPWGKAWYASLPIAGVDGTLKRRFVGTPLENNLTAKTGTLNATNALSGTFRAASGKRLTFAFFANDVPDGQSAIPAMEKVLLLIAAND